MHINQCVIITVITSIFARAKRFDGDGFSNRFPGQVVVGVVIVVEWQAKAAGVFCTTSVRPRLVLKAHRCLCIMLQRVRACVLAHALVMPRNIAIRLFCAHTHLRLSHATVRQTDGAFVPAKRPQQ